MSQANTTTGVPSPVDVARMMSVVRAPAVIPVSSVSFVPAAVLALQDDGPDGDSYPVYDWRDGRLSVPFIDEAARLIWAPVSGLLLLVWRGWHALHGRRNG